MKHTYKKFIVRSVLIYFFLLALARMPFMFNAGLDPNNIMQLTVVAGLILYRFIIFAIIPAVVILGAFDFLSIKTK